jgi:histidinol phosphatase-like PHP family hydrolase
VQLWKPGVQIARADEQDFMDRYTDFHAEVMAAEPIDILANPTFLPECLQDKFDALWTPARMRRIIDAAVRYGVAIEINSKYRVPRLPFLRMAKQAGASFSIGSNIHGEGAGKIEYCVETAKAAGLEGRDFFMPAPAGRKPIQRRRFS